MGDEWGTPHSYLSFSLIPSQRFPSLRPCPVARAWMRFRSSPGIFDRRPLLRYAARNGGLRTCSPARCRATKPFPRGLAWDRIPIALRPTVQSNPFYPPCPQPTADGLLSPGAGRTKPY
jgi:hypothetical protein